MPKEYSSLPVVHLVVNTTFSHPPAPPTIIHFEDPAMQAMTDLRLANAITISPDASILDAATEMRVCHTHLLLVVDKDQRVVGLLSSEDILGEKPLQIVQDRRIKRADILVRMLMTTQEKIVAFTMEDLRFAKVGQVVKTLHELKQHDGLAVEVEHGQQTVCGLFSLSQISRQLGFDVTSEVMEAHSLAELKHRSGGDE